MTADGESRIYGIYEDPLNGDIYGAGYILGEDSDTNAYVIKTNSSLVQQTSETYGITGTEKFRDIVITGDGYIAAGVRDNKGEGGYDCYIHHLDMSYQTVLEETFGSKYMEKLSSLMIDDSDSKVFFAGYNKEYGIKTSGNAYIGGVTTALGASQANCDLPRILLIDDLVDDSDNDVAVNVTNATSIIADCATHNIDIVFLYDVDRIYDPNDPSSQAIKDDLDIFLNALIAAQIKIGFIVGPDIGRIRNLTDIMKGVTQNNSNFHTKINYIMLEHEFWNNNNPEPGFVPLDVLNNSDYGFNWTSNPYPTGGLTDKSEYFWQLTKDHEKLLKEIDKQLPNNKNWWAALDYISYLKNSGLANAVYYDFNSQANGPGTLSLLTGSGAEMSHREGLVEHFLPWVDYTFLVNYRKASSTTHFMTSSGITVPNFDISAPNSTLTSSDWLKRLQAYSNKSTFAKNTSEFYYINLQSNEDGSNCSNGNQLGNWLGGANSYYRTELAYLNQLQNLSSTCISCGSNSEIVANAWFNYSCLSNHGAFTNNGLVSGCNTQIGIDEKEFSNSSIYPNPAREFIKVDGLNLTHGRVSFSFSDLSGRILYNGVVQEDYTIHFAEEMKGLFILTLMQGKNTQSFKIVIH